MPIHSSSLKVFLLSLSLLLVVAPEADARRSLHRNSSSPNRSRAARHYRGQPSNWMQGRGSDSQRETKGLTTWEAPSKQERLVDEEIEQAQVDYGIEDKRVARLMWKHAKDYFQARNYKKAKELIGEIYELTERDPNLTAHLPNDEIAKMDREANQRLQAPGRHSRYQPSGGTSAYNPSMLAPNSKRTTGSHKRGKPGQSDALNMVSSWSDVLGSSALPKSSHQAGSKPTVLNSSALPKTPSRARLKRSMHQPVPIATFKQQPKLIRMPSTTFAITNNHVLLRHRMYALPGSLSPTHPKGFSSTYQPATQPVP